MQPEITGLIFAIKASVRLQRVIWTVRLQEIAGEWLCKPCLDMLKKIWRVKIK